MAAALTNESESCCGPGQVQIRRGREITRTERVELSVREGAGGRARSLRARKVGFAWKETKKNRSGAKIHGGRANAVPRYVPTPWTLRVTGMALHRAQAPRKCGPSRTSPQDCTWRSKACLFEELPRFGEFAPPVYCCTRLDQTCVLL